MTKGFISQLERGNTSPFADTMDLIVRALVLNSQFFSEPLRKP